MTPSRLPPIQGLQYVPQYIDRSTEDSLLASVDLETWLWSVDHGVQMYGYRYHHSTASVFRIGELPSWSAAIAQRLHRDGFFPSVPDQLVVNDYKPGSGIFAHVDQAPFGETIASLSLGSTCVMQFSRTGVAREEEILLEPRSLLLLSGEARWDWCHGIPARTVDRWQAQDRPRARRVSLTFRSIPGETMHVFKDDRAPDRVLVDIPRVDNAAPFEGIRCPHCSWRPSPASAWSCSWLGTPEPYFESCGAVWNTFATRGLCPGCAHQWTWTSCLNCGQWSLHDDWYDDGGQP